jgi:hypothetical protein
MKRFAKTAALMMGIAALSGCALRASAEYRLDVDVDKDTYTAVCEIVKKRSGETLKETLADTASFSPTGARIILQYDGTVDHDGDEKPDKKITLPDSTHQYDLEIEEKEDGGYGYADEEILTEAGFELCDGFSEYTVGDYLYSSNFKFHFGDYLTDDLTKITLQLGRYHGFVKSDDLAWDYAVEKDGSSESSFEEPIPAPSEETSGETGDESSDPASESESAGESASAPEEAPKSESGSEEIPEEEPEDSSADPAID